MNETRFALHQVDLAILVAYALLMVGLGVYFGRKHEGADDYFLAGRRMTWPVIGISLFASNISSTSLVGLVGDAYSTGIAVFNYESMAAIVLVFGGFFFFPAVIRSGAFTIPELLERRYDAKTRRVFSLFTLFLNIVVDTAGSLYAGALVLKLLFPEIPVWQTIAAIAVIAGLYTIFGGLSAVMYTDTLQAVLLLGGSTVMAYAAFDSAGGWSAVFDQVPAEMVSLVRPADDSSVPWPGLLTGVPLLGFYFWCTNQFMAQRILSAKDLGHARWGALFAGALKLPVLFIMVLPGSAAILLYPEVSRPDLVYPTLMFDLLPTGVLGLVLAGFFAALMSQIDSTLNSASTLVTMDFVREARSDLSPHQLMRTGQLATAVFMLLAVAWAPQIERFDSLFKYLQTILAYSVPPFVTLFLAGIFWRRANDRGASAAVAVGLLSGGLLFVANEVMEVTSVHFLYAAPLVFAASSVAMVAASLTAPPPPEEVADTLAFRWDEFQRESSDLSTVPWCTNYRVLSYALVTSFLLLLWAFR